MTLYKQLFKYLPTEGHTPLENFLTECLADILGRLRDADPPAIRSFVTAALLGEPLESAFRDRLENPKLCWNTQVRIHSGAQHGYLDLCLFADSEPLVVVENKIAARFTEHSTIADSEMITISQLELYDQWLYLKNPNAALVLLTQFTEPPEGFLDDVSEHTGLDGNFKISIRRKCLWTAIYTWLTEWIQPVQNHRNEQIIFLRILVREFLYFLEEQKMAPVSLGNSDLQVLNSFFEHEVWRKMQQLLENTRKVVLPKLENPHRLPKALPVPNLGHEFDILWDFAYCFEDSLMWYIGWGIAGANGFKALEVSLAGPFPQIFVIATSEISDIPLRAEDIKYATERGWTVYERTQKQKWPRVMKQLNAMCLNNTGDRFSIEYREWVMNATAEASEILKRGHKNI